MTQTRIPGVPGAPAEAIAIQEEITAAFTHLHRALLPLLEFLPGPKASLSITRKVGGDAVTVAIRPGAKE
jgi:hypothetical protein